MVELSVVVPIYNERESIPELVDQIQTVMKKIGKGWELICVDDGSTDGSVELLSDLAQKHSFLRPVLFRRNYGQTAAMQAGFDHAQGDVVITLDADLQNDPKDIPRLLETMEAEDADIVSGWRKNRKDNQLIRNLPSQIGNKLIANVTDVRLHDYGCTLKAYRKDVLEHVRIYGELHRFIPAVISQYGAKVVEIEVEHHARKYGSSKYGLDKTFRVILDLLAVKFFLKYIHRPMHAFGMAGIFCLIPGALFATYLTLLKLFTGADIGGRPLLLLSVMLIIIGIQFIGMGILGELLVRIYHEPKGRPQYALRAIKPAAKGQPSKSAKTDAEKQKKASNG